MNTSETTDDKSNDGMSAYESLVNNINSDKELIDKAVDDIVKADATGQFSASAARFLAAIDSDNFVTEIDRLLKSAIDKDREKQYLPALLPSIWGDDYMKRAEELRDEDDNFRRIFKRVHPAGVI